MRYPWANVLVLVFGGLGLVTGYLGLTWGSHDRAIALQLHRTIGFALIALLLWKIRNIVPVLRSRKRWERSAGTHTFSVVLLALLLLTLGLGVVWSHAGPFSYRGISGVSWHIYVAIALAPLFLWHTIVHRRTMRPQYWAERRTFLRVAGLALAGLALWRAGELANLALALPGKDRRFTGSYPRGPLPGNGFPEVSWLNDDPDSVQAASWRLAVYGFVRNPLELGYDEVAGRQDRTHATLDCTGGWYTTQEWSGVSVASLLDQAQLRPEAASVTVRSVTGYYRRFSLGEARRMLLAARVGGEPLSHGHGFPLRLVAPGKRGYEWVKWVTGIEVNDTSKWWQPPLPLQ